MLRIQVKLYLMYHNEVVLIFYNIANIKKSS